MTYTTVELERIDEAIVLVTMIRDGDMNTLSLEFMGELGKVLEEVDVDPTVRALILTGRGRVFSCGAELAYFTSARNIIGAHPVAARDNYLRRVMRLFTGVENCRKPVVAAINGYALGGGAELALACDFRIMSETARFGVPEIKIGAIPGAGGVQKLHRFVGRGRALEMVMLGTHLTAEEADHYGLLYRRVPADQLRDESVALARRLAALSPLALASAKATVNMAMDADVTSANQYALEAMAVLASTEDQREGMQAFFAKREPKFPGFGPYTAPNPAA